MSPIHNGPMDAVRMFQDTVSAPLKMPAGPTG